VRELSRIDLSYRRRARDIHKENFSIALLSHPEQELKPPAIGRLGEIKCPTLVLVGDSDVPEMVNIAAHLAKEISGAKLETFTNAAHLPSLEHPTKFNAVVDEFLSHVL
jgi:pimeloyl-ACP methyl ester carboxylesterase